MSQSRNTTPAAAPVASELSAVAQAIAKRAAEQVAAKRAGGADVVRVAEFGPSGAVRMTLRCGCGAEHTRAIQDVHQARLCPDCRTAADKSKKRAKRADRRSVAKTEIAALNARLIELETALAAKAAEAK